LHPVKADLSVEAELEAALDWVRNNFGGFDVLVNSAGVFHSTPLAGGQFDLSWNKPSGVNLI